MIHKTNEVFFTFRGNELFSWKLPLELQKKKLYPSVTIGSRDDSLHLNFGNDFDRFHFDLDLRLNVSIFVFKFSSNIIEKSTDQ